ncbi:hypothetical protein O0I10_005653 [Lichtheimia ornata]|uniref:BZIP domain-containing protein n=1 Tax=Lichtheimia ornata TaxID=688661 RepID=A0AAD7XZI1_9FUNG|nr:uncharacterized protein O0I10_005653 [Lichtheimia ornata]KAJ8658613.1 hypothetical protein O0I10_005653 [Lichtheimia ornata]
MSSLESLLFGNAVDNEQSEREAAEELDLWSNAQFTFDIKPETTSTCQDETKSQQQQQSRSLDDVLDAATYEKLVNYLDYELPLQQQQQQQQHQQHTETFDNQPSSSSNNAIAPPVYQPISSTTSTTTTTTTINNNNNNNANTTATPRRPLLLPKPAPLDPLQFAASFIQQPSLPQHLSIAPPSTPTMTPTSSSSGRKKTAGTKRAASAAIESEKKTEEQIAAEEDKRRRNTAASARFRIKKKQREQAMEQTVREMKAKSDQLQERVVELEQEVKWLRGLLLEKS